MERQMTLAEINDEFDGLKPIKKNFLKRWIA